MKLILQIIAIVFIAYEVAKLIFSKKIYEFIKKKYKSRSSTYSLTFFMDTLYLLFIGMLLFTQWWKVSISLIFVSIIIAFSMFPLVKNNEPYGWKVLSLITADCIVSIFLLSRLFV